jgi:lysophospholipase L1-like esterase
MIELGRTRQHADRDVPGGPAGGLRWGGRKVRGARRGSLSVLAVVGLVVIALTAAASTAAASQVTSPGGSIERSNAAPSSPAAGNYVSLGDSYSSGFGTGVYDPASGACARSPLSYPSLWAAEHHPASFSFAACSGARTIDVLSTQISAVAPSTDLVTITIGGNDAGFAPVLQTCTAATSDYTCAIAVNAAEAFEVFVLPGLLANTYAAIRHAAPHAQVVVLGYPRLFDLASNCADMPVPDFNRRTKLNQGGDVLDGVIGFVSQQFGFSFADVRSQFASHGVCSANPWINGPSAPILVGPYHPTQTGYRNGYLPALDAATTHTAAWADSTTTHRLR